jgi:hypothetical protein
MQLNLSRWAPLVMFGLLGCGGEEVDQEWIDEANAADGIETVQQPLVSCGAMSPNIVHMPNPSTRNQNAGVTLAASCYGYFRFPGDNENDCYIKFRGYVGRSPIQYKTTNLSAGTMSSYYDHALDTWTSPDLRDVYLRMDNTWCSATNAENGVVLRN